MFRHLFEDLDMVVPGAWLSMFGKWLPVTRLEAACGPGVLPSLRPEADSDGFWLRSMSLWSWCPFFKSKALLVLCHSCL